MGLLVRGEEGDDRSIFKPAAISFPGAMVSGLTSAPDVRVVIILLVRERK